MQPRPNLFTVRPARDEHTQSATRPRSQQQKRHPALLAALASLLAVHIAQAAEPTLADLSLEQLSNIRVTSVSRRAEPLATAAASIYVITREDIRRSGARNLLEVLWLAPNLHVARLTGREFAISARGFNSTAANKLLVLLDGRSLYTPLYSGVLWDIHDVVLADIERIEVVSGPGATLWGSNAMNGVINIITRTASATHGTLLSGSTGHEIDGIALRQGGSADKDAHYRVYAKQDRYPSTERKSGALAQDGWHKSQAGFRFDLRRDAHDITVQGDGYREALDPVVPNRREMSGANLMVSWQRSEANGNRLSARAYYDGTARKFPGLFQERLDIFDLLLQRDMRIGSSQTLVIGGNYRYANDRIVNSPFIAFLPADRRLYWGSLFAQDEITLSQKTRLSLGARMEYNIYTDWEFLPDLRISHTLDNKRVVWGALSRSVRAPSRIDREFYAPGSPPFMLAGGPDFKSEVATTGELGYRAQVNNALSYSLTGFYHRYSKLRSARITANGIEFDNGLSGHTYGLEGWGSYRPANSWRLDAGFTRMRQRYQVRNGSIGNVSSLGNDPKYLWQLRAVTQLMPALELSTGIRHVSSLPQPFVPAYTSLDLHLAWTPQPAVRISLNVLNALGDRHREYGTTATGSEFDQAVYLGLTATF